MKYLSKPNGALIYSVKKDGTLYKHPTFYKFIGCESSSSDIIRRLEYFNPGHKFVAAD